jgi:hypothetical protein
MSIPMKLLLMLLGGVIFFSESRKMKICVKGDAPSGVAESLLAIAALGGIYYIALFS